MKFYTHISLSLSLPLVLLFLIYCDTICPQSFSFRCNIRDIISFLMDIEARTQALYIIHHSRRNNNSDITD